MPRIGAVALILAAIGGLISVQVLSSRLFLSNCVLSLPSFLSSSDTRSFVNMCENPAPTHTLLLEMIAQLENDILDKRLECPITTAPSESAEETERTLERVTRNEGRIGAVNIVLEWNSRDDLDLHVYCPGQRHLFYNNQHDCGGHHDVDRNRTALSAVESPVENVVWASGDMVPGDYRVRVNFFKDRTPAAQTPFSVKVLVDGTLYRRWDGVARTEGDLLDVLKLSVPFERPWDGTTMSAGSEARGRESTHK